MISTILFLLLLIFGTTQGTQPVITAINPVSAPPSGAAAFIVQGSNFGTDRTALNLTVGSVPCQISFASDAVILAAPLPPGIGRGLDIVLRITDSFTGTTSIGVLPQSFSYYAPILTSVSPQLFPTSSRSTMTIFGQYFGVRDSSPTITIVQTNESQLASWVSDTAIMCVIYPGVGAGRTIVLQVGQQYVRSAANFSYSAPQVLNVNPSVYPPQPSVSSLGNISGSGFGIFDSTPAAFVGGTQCALSIWTADTSMLMKAGPGIGAAKNLAVLVAGQSGTQYSGVSYSSPAISNLKPTVLRTDGSTTVTVFGSNFGEMLSQGCDLSPVLSLVQPIITPLLSLNSTVYACLSAILRP
jgi:hypothetical protein